MDNQRLLVWGAFILLVWFTYQAWMQDYGPAPVQPANVIEPSEPADTADSISLPELGDAPAEVPAGTLPGDAFAQLMAINSSGTAVGQSFGAAGPRAIISRSGGPLVDLNTLVVPANKPGQAIFGATGINARGDIVGGFADFSSGPPVFTAVLLTPIRN